MTQSLSNHNIALPVPWTIDTKYYVAEVNFSIQPTISGDAALLDPSFDSYDAALIVFDHSQLDSWEVALNLMQHQADDDDHPSIKACLVRYPSSIDSEEHARHHLDYHLKCIACGYELIDLVHADPEGLLPFNLRSNLQRTVWCDMIECVNCSKVTCGRI